MKPLDSKLKPCMQAQDIDQLYQICANCSVRELCLPVGFTPAELVGLDKVVSQRYTFERKEHIYHIQQPFAGLYAIQSGAVKCYRINKEGDEEVIGFFLPGELIGLEAIHTKHYESSAICLEPTKVCRLDYESLLEAANKMPNLQRQLLNVMSQRLAIQEEHAHQRTAEQRVAAFLLSLSYRYRLRGYSAIDFALPMSRQEIGNYLNLATETISRILTHFQQEKLLIAKSKNIKLLAMNKLKQIALN